jgi:hypothetical protein
MHCGKKSGEQQEFSQDIPSSRIAATSMARQFYASTQRQPQTGDPWTSRAFIFSLSSFPFPLFPSLRRSNT